MTFIRHLLALFAITIIVPTHAFLLPGTPELNVEEQQQQQHAKSSDLTSSSVDYLSEPLTTMPYGGTGLKIYRVQEHYGQPIYRFTPAAVLDRSSIQYWFSGVNNQHFFGFRLQMWNSSLQEAIAAHLTEVTGLKVRLYQIQPVPFDRVILKTNSGDDERYQTAHSWLPYAQNVGFSLTCYARLECQQLADQFKTNPGSFDHFKLAYSTYEHLHNEAKKIDINQDRIKETNQLLKSITLRFPRTNEILMTVSDTQRLLWNAVSDIVRHNFQEEPLAIVTRESQKRIYDWLERKLVTGQVTIKTIDDARWNTVYWEDRLSRPDAVARTLNERQRHIEQEHEDDQQVQSGHWTKQSKLAIDELYEQQKDVVSFDGEKFVPKSIELYRIKLNVIRDRHTLPQHEDIQIPYHPHADFTGSIIHDGPYYHMGLIPPPGALTNLERVENRAREQASIMSRLIAGQTLIVRLKNARTNEYLYPGRDELSHDAKRRRVFTWRNKDEPLGQWAEWRLTGIWRAGIFRVRFTSLRFPGEYLYPTSDEFTYDKDRRRVFTWRQASNPEDVHLWADGSADWVLETYRINAERYPNRYALFNLKRREYLYVAPDQLALDETRRRVFTWRGPENEVWVGLKNQWDIEVVRSQ